MARHRLWLSVLSVAVLAGCTTMVNKTYQKISIHTPGVENAECILETPTNKYRSLTPRTIVIERNAAPLTITCEKAGYIPTVMTVESKIRMVPAQLNVFNGILPGTAYDIASKSIYGYPETIVMYLPRDPAVLPLPQQEQHILSLKKRVVTVRDVAKAKEDTDLVVDDDSIMEQLLEDEADRSFSQSLRK